MKLSIQSGKALVLVGSQGCKKSTIARAVALQNGAFVEIKAADLESQHQDWMSEHVKTVIVQGFPKKRRFREQLKRWITSPTFRVNRRMTYPVDMPAPNFIFCSSQVDELDRIDERRLQVVEIKP